MKRKARPIPCPHSPNCFTCPLKDCVINPLDGPAALINALPTDLDFAFHRAEKRGRERVRVAV